MLRVESTHDMLGFTEFEEEMILFDEDDPDFSNREVVAPISVPLIFKNPQNPNIHKWIALVTHAKAGMAGTSARIKSYEFVLEHLQEAVRLNPADVVSLYMLGKLCYELASLTTFQRFIAKTLYHPPPEKSFKDALQYFLEAEKAKPRFYLPNLYMLGITHLKLNKMFSARYYLEVAAGIPPRTRMETEYAKKSKELADRLDKYDLTQEAIFPDVPVDN